MYNKIYSLKIIIYFEDMVYKPNLTVELYKVINTNNHNQRLDVVLEEIFQDDLQQRARLINKTNIRLDYLRKPTDEEPYWILDFSKILNIAPGQRGDDEKITDIQLQKGHDFAEETALIYIPESNYLLLQYSHLGPRIGVINDYLNNYLTNVYDTKFYEFVIKLKPDAEARLDKKSILSKIQLKVAPSELSSSFFKEGKSLSQALEAFSELNAQTVSITMTATKEEPIKAGPLTKILKRMAKEGVASVVKVEGYDDDTDKFSPVDLIKDKEKYVFERVPLSIGKRWSAETRYHYLKKAYTGWLNRGLFDSLP